MKTIDANQTTARARRVRVDYMPGPAAVEALQAAQGLFPNSNTQALIDRLVITGLSALVQGHWKPPPLYGRDRDKWKLPRDLLPSPVEFG
ncbi:hypothetical protein ASE52_07780 [Acidovorax sp. Root275]|nr:hypothetical protein ASE52_07780 [Acidovorax sp. Root275]